MSGERALGWRWTGGNARNKQNVANAKTRVNYTFGYLCINTLAVRGAARSRSWQDPYRGKWLSCCFASSPKFNWLV